MLAQSSANASYWMIEENGEIDVTGDTQISFDLIFNNTGDSFDAFAFATDLSIDLDELIPSSDNGNYDVVYYNGLMSSSTYGGTLNEDIFQVSAFAFSGLTSIKGGENLLATITFDILSPDALDGSVVWDVKSLDDSTGIGTGFLLYDGSGYILGEESMNNPDIGISAVPIPAAVWLLGSGLVALVGIRRKNT